ncbi:hypothetical protein P3X46_023074 [Hevea brasiliensis]|uniref:Leucine-rich repeat-containing N-terminal plant-type domain-containing protein n=1 Tax=Hevea brasiliensis TaxID=3981 RepID=A0ABQ9LBN8_HEVBR|nr:hypothetical protein P3X46_023074 [Hevea brasiliensis]
MKSFSITKKVILVLLCLFFWSFGEAKNDAAPMEVGKQTSLYFAIQGFGVSCDVFDGLWFVTSMSIGPIHDNSLDCASNHLKLLSFFNCFMSPFKHPITIPSRKWEKLAGNLEKLEFRSNPGLIGLVPASFGGLIKLQFLVLLENANLKKLAFAGNYFNGKIPDSFGGLTNSLQEMGSLEEMALSNNPVGGDLRAIEWHNLQNLDILDLSNMGLTGGIPVSLVKLRRLRFLGLGNNNLTGNLSPKLATSPCVIALYISGNNPTGELQFSEWFYRKMGRRFGAWNNPNLCFPVTLLEPNSVSQLYASKLNQSSHFMVTFGFSSCGIDGCWWLLLQIFMMVLLLDSFQ